MPTILERLSAYVICKNEEDWIEACIRSLAFCGEIVVVDSGSTDRTLAMLADLAAEGLPIRLFHRDWDGYSRQKQFALEQCTGEWCLCIDADESIPEELAEALPACLARDDIDAWRIEYRGWVYGFGFAPEAVREDKLLRLSRNGKARYDTTRLVHEGLIVDGKVGTVGKGRLLHRRAPELGEQMIKAITYSRLKAKQLFQAGARPRYGRLLFNPFIYFFRVFVLRRYFLCGWSGFIHAGTTAMYSFMTEAMLLQMHMVDGQAPGASGKRQT